VDDGMNNYLRQIVWSTVEYRWEHRLSIRKLVKRALWVATSLVRTFPSL
jgi:hypothetical protein